MSKLTSLLFIDSTPFFNILEDKIKDAQISLELHVLACVFILAPIPPTSERSILNSFGFDHDPFATLNDVFGAPLRSEMKRKPSFGSENDDLYTIVSEGSQLDANAEKSSTSIKVQPSGPSRASSSSILTGHVTNSTNKTKSPSLSSEKRFFPTIGKIFL